MSEVKVYYGNNQFISATKDSVLMGENPVELVMKKHYDQLTHSLVLSEAKLKKCIQMQKESYESASLYRSQGDNEKWAADCMKDYLAIIDAITLETGGE